MKLKQWQFKGNYILNLLKNITVEGKIEILNKRDDRVVECGGLVPPLTVSLWEKTLRMQVLPGFESLALSPVNEKPENYVFRLFYLFC